jgi:hypothetical protein
VESVEDAGYIYQIHHQVVGLHMDGQQKQIWLLAKTKRTRI